LTIAPATRSAIRAAAESHGGAKGAMLEALRLVQDAKGWVSDQDLAEAAATLGVATAEMESLATFYSHIFRRPVGDTLILLCDGLSCFLCGADAVRDAIMARLGVGFGETTPDGRFTLINTCCVGGCDRAPAALVGRDRALVGPLGPQDLAALLGAAP
jgi:NADH-quinone oxidoreductase subunit E